MAHRLPPAVGDLVEVVAMRDGNPVPAGTRGHVTRVHDFGDGAWQASVDWENGRHLGLVEVDEFTVVREDEP